MSELNTNCLLCGKYLIDCSKFCSKECLWASQRKRVTLTCNGCGKSFEQLPYLKRKTNYCTMQCYWDSTRLKQERVCKLCTKKFMADNSLLVKGFGMYCSRKCQFEDYPKRVIKKCLICDKEFSLQPSVAIQRDAKFCSKKCADDNMRDYVTSTCKHCNKDYELPRADFNRGRGNFCSRQCFIRYKGESYLEIKMKKVLSSLKVKFKQQVKFNRFHVDFLIRNVVVECDGEYWHQGAYQKDRDRRKDILLEGLGFKVLRITGKVIVNYSERRLQKFIKSKLFVY